jgi:anti-sigma factor RsiW
VNHIPEDMLRAFVEGDLGDQIGAHIAEHLDACAACATRAAALDPLARAFATARDPQTPPELFARILKKLDEPERAPAHEIAVGAALLLAALLLAAVFGSPMTAAMQTGAVLDAFATLGRGLGKGLASYQLAIVVGMLLTFAGTLVTVHLGALPTAAAVPARRSS